MAGKRSWSAAKQTQARGSREAMGDKAKHGRQTVIERHQTNTSKRQQGGDG